MPYPDALYIVKESEDNEELRYSLRSLKNLQHDKVFIAGYKPSWVKEDVIQIRSPKQSGRKYQNARNNLLAALKDPRLSDDFILMNDDFFIMRPTKKIHPLRGIKSIEHYIDCYTKLDSKGYYAKTMRAARDLLSSWGISSIFSYELHVPFMYNKEKLRHLIYKLGDDFRKVLPHLRTIYGNYYKIGGRSVNDVKIIREHHRVPLKSRFLSTLDEAFSSTKAGEHIRNAFPEKTIIFTHEIDTDGIGCLILANLAFRQVEHVLVTRHGYKPIDAVRDFLKSNQAVDYERIIVTDVYPGAENLRSIARQPKVLAKFYWFDHHAVSADAVAEIPLGKHAFVELADHAAKTRPCATSLFYAWLVENHYLSPTPQLKTFVQITQAADYTPDNSNKKTAAQNLKQLLKNQGIAKYVSEITALVS